MADTAVIANFEDMIAAVDKFIGEIGEACNLMEVAGNECVENCDNDTPSINCNSKLAECLAKFRESIDEAVEIRKGLQNHVDALEDIIRKSALSDN